MTAIIVLILHLLAAAAPALIAIAMVVGIVAGKARAA